jgi:hypothetical protein
MSQTDSERLDQVIAKSELAELVARYSSAIDSSDAKKARALYHDDAVDVHGGREYTADEFEAYLNQSIAELEKTAHYVVNSVFHVDGDHATGEIYKINYTRRRTGEEDFWGSRSFDSYDRREGVWKFTRRSIELTWAHSSTFDPATLPGPWNEAAR